MMNDLDGIIRRAQGDAGVLAVVLFGIAARGEQSGQSDIDVCLVLPDARYSADFLSQTKLSYLKAFDADIQIFQQLPIYIRQRVLKEGKVLFCRDEDKLYELAFKTVREFNDFEPFYRAYLREVENGG